MLEREPPKALDPRDPSRDPPPPAPHPEPPPAATAATPESTPPRDVRSSESDTDNPMICRSID